MTKLINKINKHILLLQQLQYYEIQDNKTHNINKYIFLIKSYIRRSNVHISHYNNKLSVLNINTVCNICFRKAIYKNNIDNCNYCWFHAQ